MAAQTAFNKIVHFLQRTQTGEINQDYKIKFLSFVNNDLDTPKAVALIHELLKDDSVSEEDKKATILDFDNVLKLNLSSSVNPVIEIPQKVIDLANRRKDARVNRDFALSDALREEIEKAGFVIKDTDTEVGYSIEVK